MELTCVPRQALLLTLVAVVLGLTTASHFRGAIFQWRPVDPGNFDGRVSKWLTVAYLAISYVHLVV